MTGLGISIAFRSAGGGQTTSASGSNALRAVMRTVMPSGKTRHGSPARRMPPSERLLSRVFRQRMHRPLRRHHDRLAVAQLPAAVAPLSPDEEGVDVHFVFRRVRTCRKLRRAKARSARLCR